MVVNLCIGMLTPPLGPNLFITQKIAGVSLEEVLPTTVVQVLVLYLVLTLMIIFPESVLFLPRLFGLI